MHRQLLSEKLLIFVAGCMAREYEPDKAQLHAAHVGAAPRSSSHPRVTGAAHAKVLSAQGTDGDAAVISTYRETATCFPALVGEPIHAGGEPLRRSGRRSTPITRSRSTPPEARCASFNKNPALGADGGVGRGTSFLVIPATLRELPQGAHAVCPPVLVASTPM